MNEKCLNFEEKILTGEVSEELRAHLAECPACAALERDANAFRLPKEMSVPAHLDHAVKTAAREFLTERSRTVLHFRKSMIWFSAAAAFVLAAVAFGVLLPETNTPDAVITSASKAPVSTEAEEFLYTAELDEELFSLSLDIDRTENLYASVSSTSSYFTQSYR